VSTSPRSAVDSRRSGTACDSDCEEYEDLAEEIADYKAANGAS